MYREFLPDTVNMSMAEEILGSRVEPNIVIFLIIMLPNCLLNGYVYITNVGFSQPQSEKLLFAAEIKLIKIPAYMEKEPRTTPNWGVLGS